MPLLERLPRPIPRLPLGSFPSPVEHHPGLARQLGALHLIVKRDDLNGQTLGGNKVRALEFLLPQAPPGLVTMGGYGSTWAAALARCGQAAGHSVHLALFPQPWTPAVAGTLATTDRHAAVHLAPSRWALPVALLHAWRGAAQAGPVRWMAAGGAEPWGVLGSINAALEFFQQLEQGESDRPGVLVVPLGSGGTAAGLLLGAWIAGIDLVVAGVRVTDAWFANRLTVLGLVHRTRRLLRKLGLPVPVGPARLIIMGEQLGAGYGHGTPLSSSARTLAASGGLQLEETYGAKAFAALRTLAPSFPRLCFWHTFDARFIAAPPGSSSLLHAARLHAESLWPHPKST